jgi:hypothetical protein
MHPERLHRTVHDPQVDVELQVTPLDESVHQGRARASVLPPGLSPVLQTPEGKLGYPAQVVFGQCSSERAVSE